MNTKILLVALFVIILIIGIFGFSGQDSTSNNSSNSTNQNPSYVPVTTPAQNNSSSTPSQSNIQHQAGVPL